MSLGCFLLAFYALAFKATCVVLWEGAHSGFVGSEHAQYGGSLKNFSVGSGYLEVVSEDSSCIIHF